MPFYYHGSTLKSPSILATQSGTRCGNRSADKALLVSLIGVLFAVASMHILNGLAWVSGKFARTLLGIFSRAGGATGPKSRQSPIRLQWNRLFSPLFPPLSKANGKGCFFLFHDFTWFNINSRSVLSILGMNDHRCSGGKKFLDGNRIQRF
jgi:hypothetical protein